VSKIEEWAALRPEPGTNHVIVFLDFDGVLHPDPCMDATRLFENAPRLTYLLNEYPRTMLVLSTAWRQGSSFEQLLVLLPEGMRHRVIGVTPNFSDFSAAAALIPYRRQAECMRWMVQNRLQGQAWLALDDRATGFTPYCENLIECDPERGFDDAVSARLRAALQLDLESSLQDVDLLIE
jgi:hypothetical protein